MLKAVADLADLCNFPGSPREYERKLEVLRNICSDLGKNYGQIEKSWTGDVARALIETFLSETSEDQEKLNLLKKQWDELLTVALMDEDSKSPDPIITPRILILKNQHALIELRNPSNRRFTFTLSY